MFFIVFYILFCTLCIIVVIIVVVIVIFIAISSLEVVDSTGAGDAFIGGFLVSWVQMLTKEGKEGDLLYIHAYNIHTDYMHII